MFHRKRQKQRKKKTDLLFGYWFLIPKKNKEAFFSYFLNTVYVCKIKKIKKCSCLLELFFFDKNISTLIHHIKKCSNSQKNAKNCKFLDIKQWMQTDLECIKHSKEMRQ